jgi:hypothetical protein
MLHFFHGQEEVVISHGITKRGAGVPMAEIERALKRKFAFLANPGLHTHRRVL